MSAGTVVLVVLAAVLYQFLPDSTESGEPSNTAATPVEDGSLAGAIGARQSDVMVSGGGVVVKTLPDDNDGSRHQRFIVKISSGQTVLIAHNIDLAPRVPLAEGDHVSFRGEYEWNEKGGVVHWTHHDPKQWREGGWIDFEGSRYE